MRVFEVIFEFNNSYKYGITVDVIFDFAENDSKRQSEVNILRSVERIYNIALLIPESISLVIVVSNSRLRILCIDSGILLVLFLSIRLIVYLDFLNRQKTKVEPSNAIPTLDNNKFSNKESSSDDCSNEKFIR